MVLWAFNFLLVLSSYFVCLSLDTETVNYDHYLRLGGALNFEFSLKKKKIYMYNWVGH